jgi:hypothetical protein
MTLCWERRGAWWSIRHNVKPGTPVGRGFLVFRCGLVPSPARRGRYKGRCDVCSAGVPPAIVACRYGLDTSSTDTAPVPAPVPAADPRTLFLVTGLLGRCDALASRRPSVAPSAWSLVGSVEGCDHADGAPAACFVAGRTDLEALPEGARYGIVRRGEARRIRVPAQCRTWHPVGAGFPGVLMRVGSVARETRALQRALRCL